jgi:hypothetical protein
MDGGVFASLNPARFARAAAFVLLNVVSSGIVASGAVAAVWVLVGHYKSSKNEKPLASSK